MLTDGEAKSTSSVFAGGGTVGLVEFVENTLQLGFLESDTCVCDGDVETGLFGGVGLAFDLDEDVSLLGEFDGIVDEVVPAFVIVDFDASRMMVDFVLEKCMTGCEGCQILHLCC